MAARIFTRLTCVVAFSVLLAACGGGGDNPPATNAATVQCQLTTSVCVVNAAAGYIQADASTKLSTVILTRATWTNDSMQTRTVLIEHIARGRFATSGGVGVATFDFTFGVAPNGPVDAQISSPGTLIDADYMMSKSVDVKAGETLTVTMGAEVVSGSGSAVQNVFSSGSTRLSLVG